MAWDDDKPKGRQRDQKRANPTTLAQREIQVSLNGGRIRDLRGLRRAGWKSARLLLVTVGQSKRTKGAYASMEAPDGRRVRFDLPFPAASQGGRRGTFTPFTGEPAEGACEHPRVYVYGLFAGRGRIEAAFVGVTDDLAQGLYQATRPCGDGDERKRFEAWAAEDGRAVRVAVLDSIPGTDDPEEAYEDAEGLRARWARAAALAGYELPGRDRWCPTAGTAEPIGPWPGDALAAALRDLSAVTAKTKRPPLESFMLRDAYAAMRRDLRAPSGKRQEATAAPPDKAAEPAPTAPIRERPAEVQKVVEQPKASAPKRAVQAAKPSAKPQAKAPAKRPSAKPTKQPPKRPSVWSFLTGSDAR